MDLPLNVDFTGKVVVITGAGGVICSTMARAFAQAGAKVAAINRTGIKVEKLAEELRAEGFICNGYEGNVLDEEGMKKIHEQILADFGPCDKKTYANNVFGLSMNTTIMNTSTKQNRVRRHSLILTWKGSMTCSA